MNPIVTLAACIVLGALGVRYGQKRVPLKAIRNSKDAGTALIRDGLDRAGNQMRGAAISGLSVVERQSGQLRQKLEGEVVAPAPKAPQKTSRTKRSPRKPANDTAARLDGVETARTSGHARSLVVWFDPAVTTAARLRGDLLALVRPSLVEGPERELDHGARDALLASAAVLFGIGWLPRAVQLAISVIAGHSLFREAGEDLAREGITSRALEGLAVAISLARGDYAVVNTTGFLLSLGEYLSESTARRSDMLLRDLLRPAHPSVWVMRGGQEIEVSADEVVIGGQAGHDAGEPPLRLQRLHRL